MTADRRTLGVSQDATVKSDPKAGFAATGARLDKLKDRARAQRRAPTPAQSALWQYIGDARLGGIKFTRQAIVGSTLVDFACPSRWLVVVLSPEGLTAEVEALQDKKLTDVGVRVLRYGESAVLDDAESVAKSISVEVNKPFTKPGAKTGARREAPRRDAGPRSSYGASPPRRDAGGGRGGYQR